ncbi:hypothetical protein FVEG_17279 [Fusarium verticillioides 7600]|uniref:Uncharacterized protein n=1 Tax=Gibberella moniliformis (strain M3125 / FGSC 7600) TaxID=334819 RepID=W7NCH1_GIBM7|nr:hypothetical protein FVEG_17279 [Fusarium verticillioides 7600]EWG54207.1 hypothetical protein FVEG_17279 [Fusarium verticillioides 7600]
MARPVQTINPPEEVETINTLEEDQRSGGPLGSFYRDDDSDMALQPTGTATPSSPEDSSSETPRAVARANDPQSLAAQFLEVFRSINTIAMNLFEAGQGAVNRNIIRGHSNAARSMGPGNTNDVTGDDNSMYSDSRPSTVKIVGIVAVAFVVYKALSR